MKCIRAATRLGMALACARGNRLACARGKRLAYTRASWKDEKPLEECAPAHTLSNASVTICQQNGLTNFSEVAPQLPPELAPDQAPESFPETCQRTCKPSPALAPELASEPSRNLLRH